MKFKASNNKIYSLEDISKEQIKFSDFLNTPIEQYIKEGSLKKIHDSDEIYIKLPNWGDVKLSFYNHTINFIEQTKEVESKEFSKDFKYLITTLKIKVKEGDNSGYSKFYFVPICWMYKNIDLYTSIEYCIKTINILLKNNTLEELEQDVEAEYWSLGGSGI